MLYSSHQGSPSPTLIGYTFGFERGHAAIRRNDSPVTSFAFSISASVLALLVYVLMLHRFGDHEARPIVMASVFAASALSSIGGFAFSAICGAMLFHALDDPVYVVRIMLLCSIASQVLMVFSLRRSLALRPLALYLAGGVLGLPCGVLLLLHADRSLYTHIIGSLILLYGGYMLARRPLILRQHAPLWDAVVGFLGGLTGGAAAFPGGPVTIWGSLKGWDKGRQRALYQPFILVMQLLAVVVIAALHPAGPTVAAFDLSALAYVPAALLGARCGMGVFRRLGERQFAAALSLLLITSGLGFLI